jgi:transglutaminase-like putative cysteine protease
MEYGVQTEWFWHRLWLPVPRYWDGTGTRSLELGTISPTPNDVYRTVDGSDIAYFDLDGRSITITQVFTAVLTTFTYDLNDAREWPRYDTDSWLYQRYTQPTQWVQSAHPLIAQQALDIAGAETNPYRVVLLISDWIESEIQPGEGMGSDALSTLIAREGACGSNANLFVALCRALGIPARNVVGLMGADNGDEFPSGSWRQDSIGTHVWAEYYLPQYGWVQYDRFLPVDQTLRLTLSKGNDIRLEHGHPCGPLSWIHIPQTDHLSGGWPPCQSVGVDTWILASPAFSVYLPSVQRGR